MKRKKLITVVILMFLGLTGCGTEENTDYLSNDYQVETKIISEDSILFDVCDDEIYSVTKEEIESAVDGNKAIIMQMSVVANEKIWLLGKGGNSFDNYILYDYDREKMFSSKVEIEEISPTSIVETMCSDQKGNLCICDLDGNICIMDSMGTFLFQKNMNGKISGTGMSVNGNILITVYELGECAVYEIKTEKEKLEKKTVIRGLNGLVNGTTEISKEIYMFWTDEQIAIWDGNDGEIKEILDLNLLGIKGEEIDKVLYKNDGAITIYQQNLEDGKWILKETILQPKESGDDDKEKILIFATYGDLSYEGKNKVVAFNISGHDYKIQIVDYKAGDRSYEDALIRLQADIASGNGPDIIGMESFDFENLYYGGILECLEPYMEKDDTFNTEDYFENVLKYYEKDGKTYGLITEFRVIAGMISEELSSRYNKWTVNELYKCLDENPEIEIMFGTCRSNVLNLFLLNKDTFWNQDTGKCSFNTEDFKKLLEYSYKYGYKEGVKSDVSVGEGTRLVEKNLAFDPVTEQLYKKMGIIPRGLPTGDSSRMLIGKDGIAMAMTSCSDNKQEVWEFMKFCLSEQNQISETFIGASTFPVRKDNFIKILDEWMQSGEFNGVTLSEKDKERFIAYVEEMVLMEHLDSVLFNIIMDEAEFYFNGSKTVEEVVEIIQNRAGLYMDEISY